MIAVVEQKRAELAELCQAYHVRRLDVFGSAASADRFDPDSSDLDFLVEFRRVRELNPAEQYFGLLAGLKQLFGREVDLLTCRSLRNPYFIKSVNTTREAVYAS